ncbi:tetratricopeptide repeat protein [Rheinheimera mangrovi]|uniref:tetratricopeptide repeat protein n=1 Tax=Rheinheimera mangrovi TaxID=2498451 RepID=UPI000F8C67E3|nr:tetratricopeptide repeat protein [Rheinheimera mangrovi]
MLLTELVYEDEFIKVFFTENTSNVAVITFAPLNFYESKAQRYWGESLAFKTGNSFIGVIAKSKNWYPCSSINNSLSIILELLSKYDFKFTFGTSMGGYAAIKHADKLKVDFVLSFSPQYTINPCVFGDYDKRFIVHYNESLNFGMEISADDCSKRGIVFYDRFYREDKLHIEKIAENVSNLSFCSLNFTGHFPIEIFTGSSVFQRTVKNIMDYDIQSICEFSREKRRVSSIRVSTLASVVALKRPMLAHDIALKYREQISENGLFNFYLSTAMNYKNKNDFGLAVFFSNLALRAKPENSNAIILLCNSLNTLGFSDVAKTRLKHFLIQNQNDAFVYNALAGVLIGLKEFSEAINCLKKAISILPHQDFFKRLVRVSNANKLYETADFYTLQFAETFPHSPEASVFLDSMRSRYTNVRFSN